MNLFQRFVLKTYQTLTACIGQRSTARPVQLAVITRLPNVMINNDAFEHHWTESMNTSEGRPWSSYWQLPGRDSRQFDVAAAFPDWDPDFDEDFNHAGGEGVSTEADAAVDVGAGERVHDESRAEDQLQADSLRLRQANARQEVDRATNLERPDQNDTTNGDSGYNTATPADSHKQQASMSALPEHHGVQQTSSPDSIDPLDPTMSANKLSALPATSDQDAATTFQVVESRDPSFPTFEPGSHPDTIPPSSATQQNVVTGSDRPLFRENGFGSLDHNTTTEDASQNIPVWPRGSRSVLERYVPVDTTLNDGLVRRGSDASYPNHKWMGGAAQEA